LASVRIAFFPGIFNPRTPYFRASRSRFPRFAFESLRAGREVSCAGDLGLCPVANLPDFVGDSASIFLPACWSCEHAHSQSDTYTSGKDHYIPQGMILTPKSATKFIAQCFRSPIRLI
jgi:hypothetical protein